VFLKTTAAITEIIISQGVELLSSEMQRGGGYLKLLFTRLVA
jgi:hypothetical protein